MLSAFTGTAHQWPQQDKLFEFMNSSEKRLKIVAWTLIHVAFGIGPEGDGRTRSGPLCIDQMKDDRIEQSCWPQKHSAKYICWSFAMLEILASILAPFFEHQFGSTIVYLVLDTLFTHLVDAQNIDMLENQLKTWRCYVPP